MTIMIDLNCTLPSGEMAKHQWLGDAVYRCGKGIDADIHIIDDMVSRHHANLYIKQGQVYIEDVDSTNGVWINGTRLSPFDKREVSATDVLILGESTIQFNPVQKYEAGQMQAKEKNPMTLANNTPFEDRAFNQKDFEFIQLIHEQTLDYLDLHKRSILHKLTTEELRGEAVEAVQAVLKRTKITHSENVDPDKLVESVVAEAVGLGPLEPLLEDETITEIMVNGFDKIYVERSGKREKLNMRFNSNASLMSIIERIVAPLGRRIDEGSPMVDARLKDGSRVNAIIPPLALIGPTLTIRKFGTYRFDMQDLLDKETLSEDMAKFLEVAVFNRRNMLVSGGTGSGKTTTLNVLSNFIPASERIVTIEDAAELRLNQDHVISLESRPKNVEGKGEIIIRDLVKNSLRMRPDRIVVGECRGGEALDMLQAMNTGHDGSLTTGHANSPRDLLSRLEVMVLMSGVDLPVRAIREQIASAVDIVLQQTRFTDGSRRITSIYAIDGMEGDVILMQKLFEYNQTGIDENGKVLGEFAATGQIPKFYLDLEKGGVTLDRSIFFRTSNSQIQ